MCPFKLGYIRIVLSVVLVTAPLGVGAWADPPTCTGIDGSYKDTVFTDFGNTYTGATGGWAGVTQLTGSEASTTQVLELISQRRLQEIQECPNGLVRVDGICRPTPPAPDQSLEASSFSSASKKEKYAKKWKKGTAGGEAPLDLTAEKSKFGAWAEAFADYEKRTGTIRSTQRTVGTVFGIDRTLRVNDWGVQLGLIGGYSHIVITHPT
jgi:hypothetical protein